MFILEGCLTCAVAVVAYFAVTNFPEFATWLSDEERAFVIARLAVDQGDSGVEEKIIAQSFVRAFSDWTMIPGALVYFGPTVSTYGMRAPSPTIT